MLTMTLVLRARLIKSFSLRTVANRGRLWWLSWGGAPSQYSRWRWRWWGRPAGRQTSPPALLRTSLCKKFFYQEKIFSGWTPNVVFFPRLILGVGWCCSVTELHLLKYLKQSDELLPPVADVLERLVPETTNVNSAQEKLENIWIYDIQMIRDWW